MRFRSFVTMVGLGIVVCVLGVTLKEKIAPTVSSEEYSYIEENAIEVVTEDTAAAELLKGLVDVMEQDMNDPGVEEGFEYPIEVSNVHKNAVLTVVEENNYSSYELEELTGFKGGDVYVYSMDEDTWLFLEIDGKVYVDGGVLERLPIMKAKEMGADRIVAVDVNYRGQMLDRPKNVIDTLWHTLNITDWYITQEKQKQADYVLVPDVYEVDPMSSKDAALAIERGREIAIANLDKIKQAIGLK